MAVGQEVTPMIRGTSGDTRAVGCWWRWDRVSLLSSHPQEAAGGQGWPHAE